MRQDTANLVEGIQSLSIRIQCVHEMHLGGEMLCSCNSVVLLYLICLVLRGGLS